MTDDEIRPPRPRPTSPCAVTGLDAHALSEMIHQRELSCREVMQAYLKRIAELNPLHNAIVNLADPDALLAQADERDADLAAGRSRGWMHGMPQAIKDTGHALGFPTTFGSPLLAKALPQEDSTYVARMKDAGAIIIGKTNMPEFGLGSHTTNPLFGPTPNAWDSAVSAGGSSGGAAVALALRMLPVADGSDFMGSLRNPAGWNHLFGLRPSQGRVPAYPKPELWVSQLGTDGPLARNVRDLARLLSVQAGLDPRAPLSLGEPGVQSAPWAEPAGAGLQGVSIGWLGDLGGHLPVEPGILPALEQALSVCERSGAKVEPVALEIDLDEVWKAWLVWRRALVAPAVRAALAQPGARDRIKADALWEHDQAQGLLFTDFMAASQVRGRLLHRMLELLRVHDALALPVAQVWPFPVEQLWPREVAGRVMDTYHRWMECTLYASFAGLPAISLPAGFHPNGRWPLGLQLIGRPRADAALLRLAAGYEAEAKELMTRTPFER